MDNYIISVTLSILKYIIFSVYGHGHVLIGVSIYKHIHDCLSWGFFFANHNTMEDVTLPL